MEVRYGGKYPNIKDGEYFPFKNTYTHLESVE